MVVVVILHRFTSVSDSGGRCGAVGVGESRRALGWLCVGLLCGVVRLPSDELRCTFLAVGHGGCTVLETRGRPDVALRRRALGGPDVARRQIAPFLWHQGIRRIDEVFLSHADLDHFNGLPDLFDRFAVGQVTCTPTFADKNTEGVRKRWTRCDSAASRCASSRRATTLKAGDVQPASAASAGGRAGRQREHAEHGAGTTARGPYAPADRRPGRAGACSACWNCRPFGSTYFRRRITAASSPTCRSWPTGRGRAWRCRARGRRAGRAAYRSRIRPRGAVP